MGEFVPDNQDRGGGEGGGVGARNGADEERKNEPLGGVAAEQVHGEEHENNGEGVVDTPTHGLYYCPVDDILKF